MRAALIAVGRVEGWIIGLCFILQPVSGLTLARLAGFSLSEHWISVPIALYGSALCVWLVELALRNDGMRGLSDGFSAWSGPRLRWAFGLSSLGLVLIGAAFVVMLLKPE